MIRVLALFAALGLVSGCGGSDEREVPPSVQAFVDAREALDSVDEGSYTLTVRAKAMPGAPLVRETDCWTSTETPPAVSAIDEAEAYGPHRGDDSQVDVDIPAAIALQLLGVDDATLRRSLVTEADFAPAIVELSEGRISGVTVNGAAVARRLDSDGVAIDSQLQAHAELTTGIAVFDATPADECGS